MPARPLQTSRKDISKSKAALSNSYQVDQHGLLQSNSLLLDIPIESLVHITSSLPPPSLLSLSRTNKYLYEHVKNDNTWHRAFVNQFLGIGPEHVLDNAKVLMLRKQESTWRKEFIFRYSLRRRWERSRNATVTHSPQDSAINGAHLMSENGLLTSSIQYGVIARSLPLSGKILKGYLDASGTGLGIGNPNVEFTPNVSTCTLTSDGGTARAFWGYRNGEVAVTTASRVMDPGRASAKLVKCKVEDQHEGAVQQILIDAAANTFISGGADGRVKLWDSKTLRCLWSTEKKLDSLVPDPFVVVAGALSEGVVAGALKSGDILLWSGLGSLFADGPVSAASINEIRIHSPRHIDLKTPGNNSTDSQFRSLRLVISSDSQALVLVSYMDHTYFYRLRIDVISRSNETTRFGDPSFGHITVIEPVFTTQASESNLVITGDQLGFVSFYEWDAPTSSSPVTPARRFEAHEDGAVTALAWNSVVLATGSARGTTMVWDALTLEPLRFFSSPMARPAPGRDWEGVSQILLERELLVVVVGNRVMAWKVGQVTARDHGPHKNKHARSKRIFKGHQQYEMYKDINESRRELEYENAHRQQTFGREREQRSTLDTLGLSELEAVEYVLMLSREEEERKHRIHAVDDGVFEGDFDDIHSPSTSSLSLETSSPPPAVSRAPPSRRSSSSSTYQQTGRSLPRITVPVSNEKVQVTPPFRPEPMEAGASISPLTIARRLPASPPPITARTISGSSEHFPSISSSLSSSVSTPSTRENFSIQRSTSTSPIMSRWSTPKASLTPPPGSTSPAMRNDLSLTSSRSNAPGFSLLSADIARHAKPCAGPNKGVGLDTAAEDIDDDLRFALELSLAEARSRGELE